MSLPADRTSDLWAGSRLERHEAQRLLALVTGRSRAEVVAGLPVDAAEWDRFEGLVARRLAGEPLQYIEGTAAFGPIEVLVDGRVLVPRPETEQMWERAMSLVEEVPSPVVVDLGTGSGCLALATKHARPDATVHATDVSSEAASMAATNAQRLGLDIDVRVGDLFEAVPPSLLGRIDLLLSNPPYVAEVAWSTLPVEVRDHEPRSALVGGPDGLETIRRIAAGARDWMAPGGRVVLEIGADQGHAVLGLFAGWLAHLERDLSGRHRMVVASMLT